MTTYRIFADRIVSEGAVRRGEVELDADPVGEVGDTLSNDVGEFVPIAKGKPLTVMIREVYTGRFPKKGVFKKKKDIAVLSAIKNYDVFAASSRALNFVIENADKGTRSNGPSAANKGTGVIFYSPAIITDSQLLTIELAVDDFDKEFLDTIAGALGKAGSVPLMLPHAGILMAATEVIKLGSGVAEAIFDGDADVPPFNTSIDFDIPGAEKAKADFRLLTEDGLDAEDYKYDPSKGLVHKTSGDIYNGNKAYVVISLDGKERDNLDGFKPAVATSEMIGRFMSMKSGRDVAIETMVKGLSLASDLEYRDKAEDLARKISNTTDQDKLTELNEKLDAVTKNIRNANLRP